MYFLLLLGRASVVRRKNEAPFQIFETAPRKTETAFRRDEVRPLRNKAVCEVKLWGGVGRSAPKGGLLAKTGLATQRFVRLSAIFIKKRPAFGTGFNDKRTKNAPAGLLKDIRNVNRMDFSSPDVNLYR